MGMEERMVFLMVFQKMRLEGRMKPEDMQGRGSVLFPGVVKAPSATTGGLVETLARHVNYTEV